MGTSFTLFRLFDIDVRVHWSFLLILVYGAFSFSDAGSSQIGGMLFGITTILLLFACVTLHEFGHALMAQYYDVRVPHITLLPIGGVASLEKMPDKPVQELAIAIAGPLVNFAIVLLLIPVLMLLSVDGALGNGFDIFTIMGQARQPSLTGLLTYLFAANILLGVFNLLPAFPMDGGRILRALLAMILPYVRATNIAVFIGRAVAVLFFIAGIFTRDVLTILVAFFVYVGGGSERAAVASRAVLGEYSARDLLKAETPRLFTSEPLERAHSLFTTLPVADLPIYDLGNQFVGVLSRPSFIAAVQSGQTDARIPDIMTPISEIPTCSPNTSLADVWEKMAHTGSRVIIIRDDNELAGLISAEDVSQVFQQMKERGRVRQLSS